MLKLIMFKNVILRSCLDKIMNKSYFSSGEEDMEWTGESVHGLNSRYLTRRQKSVFLMSNWIQDLLPASRLQGDKSFETWNLLLLQMRGLNPQRAVRRAHPGGRKWCYVDEWTKTTQHTRQFYLHNIRNRCLWVRGDISVLSGCPDVSLCFEEL